MVVKLSVEVSILGFNQGNCFETTKGWTKKLSFGRKIYPEKKGFICDSFSKLSFGTTRLLIQDAIKEELRGMV